MGAFPVPAWHVCALLSTSAPAARWGSFMPAVPASSHGASAFCAAPPVPNLVAVTLSNSCRFFTFFPIALAVATVSPSSSKKPRAAPWAISNHRVEAQPP